MSERVLITHGSPRYRTALSVSLIVATISLALRYTLADATEGSVAGRLTEWGPILQIECWAAATLLIVTLTTRRWRAAAHWVACGVLGSVALGGLATVAISATYSEPAAFSSIGYAGLAAAAGIKAAALARSYTDRGEGVR